MKYISWKWQSFSLLLRIQNSFTIAYIPFNFSHEPGPWDIITRSMLLTWFHSKCFIIFCFCQWKWISLSLSIYSHSRISFSSFMARVCWHLHCLLLTKKKKSEETANRDCQLSIHKYTYTTKTSFISCQLPIPVYKFHLYICTFKCKYFNIFWFDCFIRKFHVLPTSHVNMATDSKI